MKAIIIKGCDGCPFNVLGLYYCQLKKDSFRYSVTKKGYPTWCPIKKESVTITISHE